MKAMLSRISTGGTRGSASSAPGPGCLSVKEKSRLTRLFAVTDAALFRPPLAVRARLLKATEARRDGARVSASSGLGAMADETLRERRRKDFMSFDLLAIGSVSGASDSSLYSASLVSHVRYNRGVSLIVLGRVSSARQFHSLDGEPRQAARREGVLGRPQEFADFVMHGADGDQWNR